MTLIYAFIFFCFQDEEEEKFDAKQQTLDEILDLLMKRRAAAVEYFSKYKHDMVTPGGQVFWQVEKEEFKIPSPSSHRRGVVIPHALDTSINVSGDVEMGATPTWTSEPKSSFFSNSEKLQIAVNQSVDEIRKDREVNTGIYRSKPEMMKKSNLSKSFSSVFDAAVRGSAVCYRILSSCSRVLSFINFAFPNMSILSTPVPIFRVFVLCYV